jgi:hypothetical protein
MCLRFVSCVTEHFRRLKSGEQRISVEEAKETSHLQGGVKDDTVHHHGESGTTVLQHAETAAHSCSGGRFVFRCAGMRKREGEALVKFDLVFPSLPVSSLTLTRPSKDQRGYWSRILHHSDTPVYLLLHRLRSLLLSRISPSNKGLQSTCWQAQATLTKSSP